MKYLCLEAKLVSRVGIKSPRWKIWSKIKIHQVICLWSIFVGQFASKALDICLFLDWTLSRRTRNAINQIITPSVPLSSFPPLCAGQLFVQIIVEIHLQYKDDYHNNAYKHPAPYGLCCMAFRKVSFCFLV